jgi:hypothetical protein
MTGGDYLKSRFREFLAEAEELASHEFDAEQMSRFVRDAAALFERFFKRMRLTRPPADPSLNNLINALKHEGVTAPERAKLHRVRTAANEAKHDPSRLVTYADVALILAGAIEAVDALAQHGIAEIVDHHVPRYRRRFLLALWDHLAAGESEMYVWPAVNVRQSETGVLIPSEMESFQFRYADEEKALQQLNAAGDLHWEGVGEPTLSALRGVGDFARAGHWEGEYRDLIAAALLRSMISTSFRVSPAPIRSAPLLFRWRCQPSILCTRIPRSGRRRTSCSLMRHPFTAFADAAVRHCTWRPHSSDSSLRFRMSSAAY